MSTITKTIGSAGGRDYASVASWLAAVPTNMSGNDYRGEVYNDSELTCSSLVDFASFSNGTLTLTAASGQSWADQATPVTRYDTTKGACLKLTADFQSGMRLRDGVTVSRLQCKAAAATILYGEIAFYGSAQGGTVDNCIFSNAGQPNPNGAIDCGNFTTGMVRNNLIIRGGGGTGMYGLRYQTLYNILGNTLVIPSDAASYGTGTVFHAANVAYGGVIKDNAAFGFATFFSAGNFGSATCSNNAGDITIAYGTSNQASLTYANEITNTAAATLNLRPKSGGQLAAINGVANGSLTTDAFGVTRPSPPTIGAIEFVSGGGGTSVALTGIAATASLGTLAPGISPALTGQAVTSARGTLAPAFSLALTGIAATGGRGTLVPGFSLALTGLSGTASPGTLTPTTATVVALTGIAATAGQGSLSAGISLSLLGQGAATGIGTLTPVSGIVVALTGIGATAGQGSFGVQMSPALSGQAATASPGTLVAGISKAISGNAASASLGSLSVSFSTSISGVSVIGALGNLGVQFGNALSGLASIASLGTLTPHISGAISISPERTYSVIRENRTFVITLENRNYTITV